MDTLKKIKSKVDAAIENTWQSIAEKIANKDNAEENGEITGSTMSPKDIVIATDDIVLTGNTQEEWKASQNATILRRISDAFQDFNIGDNIKEQLTNIVDRAEEWNSGAFLVLVVGPVKSGKSTLVNLLANDYVSPTDKLECTNRPTIISAGEKREISTFQSTDKSNIEKDINIIINSIRKGEHAPNFIVCNKKELSEDGSVIENELFPSGMKREFDPKLLTTITTNQSTFLEKNEDNKQIFLIDMPGFDGKESNTEIDKSHFAIAKRVDLILFVHSSASAFSVASDKFLEEIRKINKNIPVFLVHNVYDAAYWLEESEKKKTINKQVENEKKEISQYLQLDNNVVIINLGRVYDYLNNSEKIDTTIKDYSKEYAENDLQNLLDKLNKNIKENISDIRISTCRLSTKDLIKALNESINIEIDRLHLKSKNFQLINSILDDYEFKDDYWNNKKTEIADILRDPENTRVFDREIKNVFLARKIQKPLEDIFMEYIKNVSEKVNKTFLKKDDSLKKEFIKALNEIIDQARKKNSSNSFESTNDKIKDKQKEDFFDEILKKIKVDESVLRTVSFKILEDANNGETILPMSLREQIKSYVNNNSRHIWESIDSSIMKGSLKEHFAGKPAVIVNGKNIKEEDGYLMDDIKVEYENMRQNYIKQIRDLLLNDECCNQTEEDKKKEKALTSLKETLNKYEF